MEADGGAISSNDIIMSSLCEMCASSDVFAFDKSVRGVKEGVSKSAAGNFFWEVTLPIHFHLLVLFDSDETISNLY